MNVLARTGVNLLSGKPLALFFVPFILKGQLGIDPPTTLTRPSLDYFGLDSVEEMLHLDTGRGTQMPRSVYGLTGILLDEAEGGDEAARHIVLEHARGLGNYAIVGGTLCWPGGHSF